LLYYLVAVEELALYAVGLSLREVVIVKYKSVYAHNRSMNDDPIYTSWKMYTKTSAYRSTMERQYSERTSRHLLHQVRRFC